MQSLKMSKILHYPSIIYPGKMYPLRMSQITITHLIALMSSLSILYSKQHDQENFTLRASQVLTTSLKLYLL